MITIIHRSYTKLKSELTKNISYRYASNIQTSLGKSEYSFVLSTATILVSKSLVIRTNQFSDWVI